MAARYLENARNYAEVIRQAAMVGDMASIEAHAHPLRSSSAMLGFSELADHAEAIESAARNGRTPDCERVRALINALERVEEALSPLL